MQRRKVGFALGLGILAALVPLAAMAQGAPGLSPQYIQPKGYFDFTLNPGQSATNTVQITNLQKTTETYEIYTVDAATDVTGGVSLNNLGVKKVGVGNWITLVSADGVQVPGGIEKVTLAAGKSKELNFSVKVPAGTVPEDAVGGIVGQNVVNQGPSPGGQFNITLVPRVGLAVVIHVTPLTVNTYKFGIGTPKLTVANQRTQVLDIPLDNQGNRLIKPEFQFNVYNLASSTTALGNPTGKPIVAYDKQLDTFTSFTTVIFPYTFPNSQILGTGCYEVVGNVYQVAANALAPEPTASAGGVANTSGRTLIGHSDDKFCVTGAQTALPLSPKNFPHPWPTWVIPAIIAGGVILLGLIGFFFLAWRRSKYCCKACRKIKECECKSNKSCSCDDVCSKDCPEEIQKAARQLREQRKAQAKTDRTISKGDTDTRPEKD